MSFKTIVEWATGDPPVAGWYNTLIINNKGIPEVMTMKWTNEDKWDNPSWEVRGWCPFPLTCEFMDVPEVISEGPEATNKNSEAPTVEQTILWLANNLTETFSNHTSDGVITCNMAKQIIVEYIRNGGLHANK